ncbi:hypothetical protein M1O19_06245 [Dehalococcoidia bacterium]|nr:hypothetical protein [Dehalococcoidia bacterium]MCL0098093.1 hypothetical protein [Dehalococcoidia bacterium]
MRIAAMVLGILGGLFGAYGAHLVLPWPGELLWSLILFLFSLIAIAGGILALRRPAVGGILMLIPWIGFFLVAPFGLFREYHEGMPFVSFWLYIIASLLLFAGAILALADYQSRSIARIVALVLGISAGVIGALGVYGGVPVVPGGFLALGALLSTMGIAGAVLTRGRPGVAGTLMLVSGIGGFAAALIVRVFAVELSVVHYLYTTATVTGEAIIFCMAYAIAGFPMIAGAILALAAREKWPQERLSS